ncbi:TIGR02391 family protein [Arthrobacter sp. I2-34]|uniref:TIGR02391 family protein n=1 Tax=Arthrobacter hankyongi TaxID=2904801 RepID=A0ABS9LDD1_9MICC|nr:TIGR02391 family protein [Arthrobacter hankyongi]MCG2624694.1 TIGR02391 family protein [Arthrobacter hankyongi]
MDNEWALTELRRFIQLTQLQQPQSGGGVVYMGDFATPVGNRSDIIASAQIVEQILDRVLPRWRTEIRDDGKRRWTLHREAAQRAVVQIEQQAMIAEKLGDNAPMINTSAFHAWAWEGARSLWHSGHYREAVRAASVKVNAELQNKLGRRDVSEQTLFQEAFSNEAPQPGKPRLRPQGDDDGKTARSVRRGIVALAEGCYAAIRNPASHDHLDEFPEQLALEQLAAFSLLARWIDAADLLRH